MLVQLFREGTYAPDEDSVVAPPKVSLSLKCRISILDKPVAI
jgi:hypothetical protein